MKYIRGNQAGETESYKKGKISLTDGKGFTETSWTGIIDDKEVMLLNDALAFLPYKSIGAILPNVGRFNFLEMLESETLTLHPEVYDEFLKHGILDQDGNALKTMTF